MRRRHDRKSRLALVCSRRRAPVHRGCAAGGSVSRYLVGRRFAMIGATLTTRLAQYGIKKSAVTIFALTFLAYNFKILWAPPVDNSSSSIPSRRQQR